MNTQGWMRGLMSRNMGNEEFFNHVIECIEREFDLKVEVLREQDKYMITLEGYTVDIKSSEICFYKDKSPYSLDRYILDSLRDKGYAFDIDRSKYLECCFGHRDLK